MAKCKLDNIRNRILSVMSCVLILTVIGCGKPSKQRATFESVLSTAVYKTLESADMGAEVAPQTTDSMFVLVELDFSSRGMVNKLDFILQVDGVANNAKCVGFGFADEHETDLYNFFEMEMFEAGPMTLVYVVPKESTAGQLVHNDSSYDITWNIDMPLDKENKAEPKNPPDKK